VNGGRDAAAQGVVRHTFVLGSKSGAVVTGSPAGASTSTDAADRVHWSSQAVSADALSLALLFIHTST
jgi:hypothetical protein